MGIRYAVIFIERDGHQHANWFDAGQLPRAEAFAEKHAPVSGQWGGVIEVETGQCGCGPPRIAKGGVEVESADWGECLLAAGPDCACDCHALEGLLE